MKYLNKIILPLGLTGTEWHLSLKSFLRLGSNRPVLGPIIMAPISAAIPPMTWTDPLPARSCRSKKEIKMNESTKSETITLYESFKNFMLT